MDSIGREIENPALEPFIDLIGREFDRDQGGVLALATEALDYTRDTVWHMVGGEPAATQAADHIVDACVDLGGACVSIATLNHDRLLDRAFKTRGVPYAEGFGGRYGDLRIWDDSFKADDDRTWVLRPHGCVDWFRFQIPLPEEGAKLDVAACTRDQDKDHLVGPEGERLDPSAEGRPSMLVGTFTKMLNYGRSIFADTHARLHEAMRDADVMVIIGYGFGDKGINSRVIHWLASDTRRTACVVHPDPGQLLEREGRVAARANLRHWERVGRIALMAKKAEDAPWDDIKSGLHALRS